MSCTEIKTAKYQTRKSPAFHAKDCKNQTKEGKDGTPYVSKPDARGVYKWVPAGTQTRKAPKGVKTYKIHDNGATPFVVEDDGKGVTVFKTVYAKGVYDKYTIGDPVLQQPYQKIFVGDNDSRLPTFEKKGWAKGNTLLVVVSPTKLLYIGSRLYTFEPVKGDTIQAYYSPVGNSDVPYPWAVGTTHTYLLGESVFIPNSVLEPSVKNPYVVYYGDDATHPPVKKHARKLQTKNLKV
jgi:hypothetical protein